MKNTELFDILGKIDDKFYDEALGGDSERPIKIQIKNPAFSVKNVLMPVAACLAVAAGIGVTAHFLSRADFIDPNPATSDVALANPKITPEDFEQCKELVQKYLTASNEEFDFEHNTQIIDIDHDGCDELVMTPNFSTIVIFDKTVEGMVEAARLDVTADITCAQDICEYESDGERYFYLSSRGLDSNGVIATAAARINFNEGEYSIDYPLAYGYYYQSAPKEYFFMTGCADASDFMNDPVSNITAAEFKAKWEKHTGLPRFDYHLSFKNEYPLLSETEIPVVESSHGEMSEALPHAVVSSVEFGEYKVCLLADTVFRLKGSDDPDLILANALSIGLVKDDKLVSVDAVRFNSAARSGAANFRLYPQKSKSYFKLYEFSEYDNFAVATVGFANFDNFGWESNFFGIKDGTVTGLFGKTSPYSKGVDPCVNAPFELTVYGNSLIDNENAVKYEFYPDAFDGNPYEVPHFTTNVYLPEGEYPAYNGQAAPKTTLCEKKLSLDNGTVKLLALDAKPVTKNGIECVEFSQLFLRADFGSDYGWVKPVNVPGSLPVSKLDECLVPILFNAGKPDSKELIVVFWGTDKVSPAGEKYDVAVFHSAGNGEPFHMDQSQSGAIIPSGDPCELGAFTVSPEGCMISLDVGVQISFDFTNYTFKDIYPEQ